MTITTLGRSSAGSFASSRITDHPSIRGIITSSTISSGWFAEICAIASTPLRAVETS